MTADTQRSGTSVPGGTRAEPAAGQYVGFRLDGEDYAVAITTIREIILMKPITRLPQVPGAIEGVINLRGNVIPVVNLRKRFGLPDRPHDDETRTVVATIGGRTVGLIVDEVTQVLRIAAEQVQPVPLAAATAARRSLAGLARLGDRLTILLDLESLFAPGELELATPPTLAPPTRPPGPGE